MRVATAAYPVERLESIEAWEEKLSSWVSRGAEGGADLLVFPEYAALEAALAAQPPTEGTEVWERAGRDTAAFALETARRLAVAHGVHLLTGSGPWDEGGRTVNRCHLIAPDGTAGAVDKQILTPWERRETRLAPGRNLALFDTALGRIGVLICYDAEFPLLARALNCDLLLIPSCTDAATGAARVRNAARARALEGRCITVMAATVGEVAGCEFLDRNTGRAGLYAPPDRGFPPDGVLADGAVDLPGWVQAEVATAMLAALRGEAEVDIPAHWRESEGRAAADPRRLSAPTT